jgi:hypothetical protein
VLGVEPAVIGAAEAFKGSAFDHLGSPGISILRASRFYGYRDGIASRP